jgi:hypothetical protein
MLIRVNSRIEVTTDTIRTGMYSVPQSVMSLIIQMKECSSWATFGRSQDIIDEDRGHQ